MLKKSDSQLLGRILELDGERLSPERARLVLSLDFPQSDSQRIERLGEKSNGGRLTAREREEYEAYVRVGDVLSILKSRARLLLKKHGKTA